MVAKLHSKSVSDSPESETAEQGWGGECQEPKARPSLGESDQWLRFSGLQFPHLENGDDNTQLLFLWTSKVTLGGRVRAGFPLVGSQVTGGHTSVFCDRLSFRMTVSRSSSVPRKGPGQTIRLQQGPCLALTLRWVLILQTDGGDPEVGVILLVSRLLLHLPLAVLAAVPIRVG